MYKAFLFSLLTFSSTLLVTQPVYGLDKNECQNNATQLKANDKSLKKVETALKKAANKLKGMRKAEASGDRRFDKVLLRYSTELGDFGSQFAGELGIKYDPELATGLFDSAYVKVNLLPGTATAPLTPAQVIAKTVGTLKDIYAVSSANSGRGTFVLTGTVGTYDISDQLDKVAANDKALQDSILARMTDWGQKIYTGMTKRSEDVVKYQRSPLKTNIGNQVTTIGTLSTNRDDLLKIRNNTLLPTKRNCDAAGL